jgi:hypothetical protein
MFVGIAAEIRTDDLSDVRRVIIDTILVGISGRRAKFLYKEMGGRR